MSAEPVTLTIADDALRCPLCDYDLRGLTQNRCPECGHAFDPTKLRAAKLERKKWFFEHAPKGWRIAAFVITALGALWPVGLWRDLAAADVIVRRRLTLWGVVWSILIAAVPVGFFAAAVCQAHNAPIWSSGPNPKYSAPRRSTQPSWITPGIGNPPSRIVANVGNSIPFAWPTGFVLPGALVSSFHTPDWNEAIDLALEGRAERPYLEWALAVLAWPILTGLAMRLFAVTMRRAGVRNGHLLRCTRYAMPSLALVAVATFTASRITTLGPLPVPRDVGMVLDGFTRSLLVQWALFGAIVASTAHLVCAYARYLRLPHAVATALLVQCVSWLTIAVGLYYTR